MEWLANVMTSNFAVGVVLLLGYVIIRLVERKADARINGHFSARDRELLTQLADSTVLVSQGCQRCQERNIAIMSAIQHSEDKIEHLTDSLEKLIQQTIVSNTQLAAALGQLTDTARQQYVLLTTLAAKMKN